MRGDVLGRERRRRWRDDEKFAIVLSVGVDGATVTSVAQHHEITRQQIYTWRHELRKRGLLLPSRDAVFLPVDTSCLEITRPEREDIAPAVPVQIELRLGKGRSLHFDSSLNPDTLTRLIRAVEMA